MISDMGTAKKKDLSEYAGGIDISYTQERYRVICEYVIGKYEGYSDTTAGETYDISEVKPGVMYLTAGYRPLPGVEIPVRYEIYDKDSSTDDAGIQIITLGVTISLKGHPLNDVKINYITSVAEDNYGSDPDDQLAVQIQLAF